MNKNFDAANWREYLPNPVCDAYPEYRDFYIKAWEMARDHVKHVPGMPQDPYMDEAFCETQVWIWDTCFMSMFCKFAQEVFPGVETFKNFYEVIHGGKLLPEVIPSENEPAWTRAIPGIPKSIDVHIADNPPLFAWGEYENAMFHGDRDYLRHLLYEEKMLQKHYEWVESLKEKQSFPGVHAENWLICEEKGYRWEGGRSGMDNTPRGRIGDTCERPRPQNPDMLWIDAICQQALSAKMLSRMFEIIGDRENAKTWNDRFEKKKRLVNELYWDEKDKFYYDIDCKDESFYRVVTIASYWALTAGIATREQATAMAEKLLDEKYLGGELPFLSLARCDGDFSDEGKYWRGSMWLPTAYATLKGLTEYGLHAEAHRAACDLLKYMYRTYVDYEPHTIWECYAPTGHRPGTTANGGGLCRPDFCGWSALGPITVYIEYVLGFHTVNAFDGIVKWEKPTDIAGKIGIENLSFGDVVTDIVAEGSVCRVKSNAPYTLEINGRPHSIAAGENIIEL